MNRWLKASGALLLCAALGIVSSLAWCYQGNTLNRNGKWVSTKAGLSYGVMGALHYVSSRQAVAQNRLNLGAWNGFQELTLNEPVSPKHLQFRYALEDGAYVAVIFNRGPHGYSGLRLSRHPLFPSAYFQADRSGRFTQKTVLDLPATSGWHQLRLNFGGGKAEARLDGRRVWEGLENLTSSGLVSLKGSLKPAFVDDFRLEQTNGDVLSDSFDNFSEAGRYALSFSLFYLAALMTFVWILRRRFQRPEALAEAYLGFAVALGVLLLAYSFDYLFWSPAYLKEEVLAKAGQFKGWGRQKNGALSQEFLRSAAAVDYKEPSPFVELSLYGEKSPHSSTHYAFYKGREARPEEITFGKAPAFSETKTAFRTVFLGSSQTWGSGAMDSTETFVALWHSGLGKCRPGRAFETMNLSRSSTRSGDLLDTYLKEDFYEKYHADLVVINLAFNDQTNLAGFEANLEKLVALNESIGATTVLAKEASSLEKGIRLSYEAIDRVARAHGLKVLDLNGELNQPAVADSGFLWWDQIHLTPYGHRKVSESLLSSLEPLLPFP